MFFKRYDKNNDGRIRYSDFCEIFIPKTKEYAKLMSNRGAMSSTGALQEQGKYVFSLETQTIFSKMLRVHIEVEHECEMMRFQLSRNRDFNSHQVFMFLDRDNNGYISMNEFRKAF